MLMSMGCRSCSTHTMHHSSESHTINWSVLSPWLVHCQEYEITDMCMKLHCRWFARCVIADFHVFYYACSMMLNRTCIGFSWHSGLQIGWLCTMGLENITYSVVFISLQANIIQVQSMPTTAPQAIIQPELRLNSAYCSQDISQGCNCILNRACMGFKYTHKHIHYQYGKNSEMSIIGAGCIKCLMF